MNTDVRTRLGRITVARVDAALNAVVNRLGPNHIDHTHYFFSAYGGQPGCLVGQILAELGVDGVDRDNLQLANTPGILTQLNADIEPAAAMYLYALQLHNDRDQIWGRASEAAWHHVQQMYATRAPGCGCSTCSGNMGADYWGRLTRQFLSGPPPQRGQVEAPSTQRPSVRLSPAEVDRRWTELTYGALAPIEVKVKEWTKELVSVLSGA